MNNSYRWLVERVNKDLEKFGTSQKVYTILREDPETIVDYFVSIKKLPDIVRIKSNKLKVKQVTLEELKSMIVCDS
ncbi:hypothetical protein ACFP65_08430 [Marinilactibacillus sp. GCM10026970]|uniref:hypothetical protein n=1 Tax=Marinilactibacillus sp. GCM10026970 TaxID=3252642 RepID=UPI00360B8EB6